MLVTSSNALLEHGTKKFFTQDAATIVVCLLILLFFFIILLVPLALHTVHGVILWREQKYCARHLRYSSLEHTLRNSTNFNRYVPYMSVVQTL